MNESGEEACKTLGVRIGVSQLHLRSGMQLCVVGIDHLGR